MPLEMNWQRQPQTNVRLSRKYARRTLLGLPMNGASLYDHGQRALVSGTSANMMSLGSSGSFRANERGIGLFSDGLGGCASVPLNMSSTSVCSLSMWVKMISGAADGSLMEHGPNVNTDNGFFIDWFLSTKANSVGWSFEVGGNNSSYYFAQPSSGVFHHVVIGFDATNAGKQKAVYVDGLPVTVTVLNGEGANFGAMASNTLHFFSRNEASLLTSGYLQDFFIFDGMLSSSEVWELYTNPYAVYAPVVSVPKFGVTPVAGGGFRGTTNMTGGMIELTGGMDG